jgi:hypothetical protein
MLVEVAMLMKFKVFCGRRRFGGGHAERSNGAMPVRRASCIITAEVSPAEALGRDLAQSNADEA